MTRRLVLLLCLLALALTIPTAALAETTFDPATTPAVPEEMWGSSVPVDPNEMWGS